MLPITTTSAITSAYTQVRECVTSLKAKGFVGLSESDVWTGALKPGGALPPPPTRPLNPNLPPPRAVACTPKTPTPTLLTLIHLLDKVNTTSPATCPRSSPSPWGPNTSRETASRSSAATRTAPSSRSSRTATSKSMATPRSALNVTVEVSGTHGLTVISPSPGGSWSNQSPGNSSPSSSRSTVRSVGSLTSPSTVSHPQ